LNNYQITSIRRIKPADVLFLWGKCPISTEKAWGKTAGQKSKKTAERVSKIGGVSEFTSHDVEA